MDKEAYGRQYADFYDDVYPWNASAEAAVDTLASLVSDSGPVLEMGVGTGRIAIPLAMKVGPVVGVDSSPEMLAVLEKRAGEKGAEVVPVQGDMCAYEDEHTYELIYCVCSTLSMIMETSEQRQTLERMASLLRPGGHLVVEMHNPGGIRKITEGRAITTFFQQGAKENTGVLATWAINEARRHWHCSHVWFDNGTFRITSEEVRLTESEEVADYAISAGLTPVGLWSDWNRKPFDKLGATHISVFCKEVME